MPVQMIELEEVTMFEYSDDAFEATVAGYGGGSYSACSTVALLCGGSC
jgi:hypothetical protein